MGGKVISMYKKKKEAGRNIIMTDELIDKLAEEYLNNKETLPRQMTFIQWVEYKTMKLL